MRAKPLEALCPDQKMNRSVGITASAGQGMPLLVVHEGREHASQTKPENTGSVLIPLARAGLLSR